MLLPFRSLHSSHLFHPPRRRLARPLELRICGAQVKNAFRLEQSRALKLWDLAVELGWIRAPAAEGSQRGSKGALVAAAGGAASEERDAD